MKRNLFALTFILAIAGAFAAQAGNNKSNFVQYYKKPGGTGACATTSCIPNGTGAACSTSDTYWLPNEDGNCGTQQSGTFKLP